MFGSGFVISTDNTEIDMAMSAWSRLTRYNHMSPAQAICDKQPDISQPSRRGCVLHAAKHYHGLSRRYDGSHYHECDLWARSPIRERHIRWQIWHSKLLVDGVPDLRGSRLASNS